MRRSGQVIVVACLAMAAFAVSGNPLLIAPAWWGVTYVAFRMFFPVDKKALAAPLAIQSGQLAWLITLATIGPTPAAMVVPLLLLGGGLVWLYLGEGLAPAIALIVFQTFFLVRGVQFLVGTETWSLGWRLPVIELILRVIAIGLIARYLWGRRRRPADPATVFE